MMENNETKVALESENELLTMDVIRVVKFSEFMDEVVGNFMDEYYAKEGWELQLIRGRDGDIGYQTFFGKGVCVDNYEEYGFRYLYDLEDVIGFAENFYKFRSSD